MATTALSVGDLMRGDEGRCEASCSDRVWTSAGMCLFKDGLVSQIPDRNLKAHEAVLICHARRRIGTYNVLAEA